MPNEAFARNFPWEATFITQLKRRREGLGWTQTDLARKLKVRGLPFHQQTVQRVENGERAIRLDEAHVIAELFSVPLEVMLNSYEGPLAQASDDVVNLQRAAEGVAYAASDTHGDYLGEFDALAVDFLQMLEASGRRATPEVIWSAAWLIKAHWVIESLEDVASFASGMNTTDSEWQSVPQFEEGGWAEISWIADESTDLWSNLPAEQNPVLLAEKTPAEIQAWLKAALDGIDQAEA